MTRCLHPVFRDRGDIISCGKCIPCKIKRRAIWSVRMMDELTTSSGASFVTLTYDDRHILRSPSLITHAGTLSKHHLQVFFKRLRRRRGKDGLKEPIKYYACGEYGDTTNRPHYHAIIFNCDSAYLNRYPRDDDPRKLLDILWHHGVRNEASTVTEGRIQYVAGYIEKKLFGELGERAYRDVEPPFQISSNGIGKEFALRNYEQILYDAVIKIRDKSVPVPAKYFDWISQVYPNEVEGVKDRKRMAAKLAGIDFLLENFPEYGGRSYEQLDDHEKRSFGYWLAKRSKDYFEDLKARIGRKKEFQQGANYV